LGTLTLTAGRQSVRMSKITYDGLTRSVTYNPVTLNHYNSYGEDPEE